MIRVLILYSQTGAGQNIQDSIERTGHKNLSITHCRMADFSGVPSLATCVANYDVMVFDSCNTSIDPVSVGDLFYEFVAHGKHAVLFVFSNYTSSSQRLGGKFETSTLHPMMYGSFECPANQTLGQIHLPQHSLIQYVKTFNGGTASSHIRAELRPGSTCVASWENGYPLVSFKQEVGKGMVVCLNTFGQNKLLDESNFCWDNTTDGNILCIYYFA